MRGFGKGAAAGLACVGLGLAGFAMGVEESVGAAAVYFAAVLLTVLLTAVLMQAANAPLVEELEMRIRALRPAMVTTAQQVAALHGAMNREGFVATIEDMEVPESWPSVGCENPGHKQRSYADWRCPDCGSVWWDLYGQNQQPAGYHVEAFLWRLLDGLPIEVRERAT